MELKKGKTEYFVFENIEKTGIVSHCFSSRIGGVSKGYFKSLNLGLLRGDERENVLENYDRILEDIGLKKENAVLAK